MKNYLLSRAESLTAWIGIIGLVLEVVLHMGHTSTIMVILFILLIVLPEANFRTLFADWTKSIKDHQP